MGQVDPLVDATGAASHQRRGTKSSAIGHAIFDNAERCGLQTDFAALATVCGIARVGLAAVRRVTVAIEKSVVAVDLALASVAVRVPSGRSARIATTTAVADVVLQIKSVVRRAIAIVVESIAHLDLDDTANAGVFGAGGTAIIPPRIASAGAHIAPRTAGIGLPAGWI